MGQVDDFQAGEEAVAQMREEQAERDREQLTAELNETPLADTAQRARRTELIDISQISTGFNLRRKVEGIEDLARSIAQRGLHTALEVRDASSDEEGDYVLISGHRRLAALELIAEVTGQPVQARAEIVDDVDEADHFALQLIENDHEPLAPEDWARGIRMLLNKHEDWDAKTLAKSIGKPVSFAQRHLRLLELPAAIRTKLEAGDLSFTAADLLRKATKDGTLSEQEAEQRAEALADGELSTADLKDEVRPAKASDADDDGPDLDDWGSDQPAPRTPANMELGRYEPPVGPADRGADAALDAEADALLAGGGSSGVLPWENEPLGDVLTDGRAPTWTLLDAYLLGRVLRDLASDSLLDELGLSREEVFSYADSLTAGDRASQLRKIGQALLREDGGAPVQYQPAAASDI
jgi:ParB/RepB/Spo0J family partition protein